MRLRSEKILQRVIPQQSKEQRIFTFSSYSSDNFGCGSIENELILVYWGTSEKNERNQERES